MRWRAALRALRLRRGGCRTQKVRSSAASETAAASRRRARSPRASPGRGHRRLGRRHRGFETSSPRCRPTAAWRSSWCSTCRRDHKSMLVEIWPGAHAHARGRGRRTARAVGRPRLHHSARNAIIADPDGVLHFASRPATRSARPRADRHFFRSLAEDQGERAIGIMLSGTGSDGTLGLRAIKEHGGLTIAQAPDVRRVRRHAAQRRRHRHGRHRAAGRGDAGAAARVRAPPARHADAAQAAAMATASERPTHLPAICALLRAQTGHDFSAVQGRARCCAASSAACGAPDRRARRPTSSRCGRTPQRGSTLLFRDLLIGVTSFFRDPEAFDGARAQGHPASCSTQAGATSRCASGCPAAPPARRPTRSPSCCSEAI